MIRKEVFEKVGGFDEDMQCLEDWDFVLKVSKAYEIGFPPGVSWKLLPRRRASTGAEDDGAGS